VSDDDPYTYPGSTVLRNKFGIVDSAQLDQLERRLVAQRSAAGVPTGKFDLAHLRAIHRHLFQDIYAWAGKIRTVEIAKDGHQFQFRRFISTGMADVHRRLVLARFLRGLTPADFADAAGTIVGDVNYVHPFREGNGRTQLLYLEQLAEQAGHKLDLRLLDPVRWLAASRAAHGGDYAPMSIEIARALEGD
jgi:cell filamentation protein